MSKKNNWMLRIDKETLEKMKRIKRELSTLEEKDIAMGEIVKRTVSSDEIIERLRLGARERRFGLR